MIVEHFRDGDAGPVYERLRGRGRMTPEGLDYVASWIRQDLRSCFQLMETDDPALLEQWMAQWRDLVVFEVHEVVATEEAVARALGRT